MRKRLAGIALLVVMCLWLGPLARAATVEAFTAELGGVEFGEPEREWIGDGVLHLRGQPITATVIGDLVGTLEVIGNVEIDLATGLNYTFYGSFTLTTSDVTWEGRLSGVESGDTRLVGHGDDGSILQAVTPVGSLSMAGTILTP